MGWVLASSSTRGANSGCKHSKGRSSPESRTRIEPCEPRKRCHHPACGRLERSSGLENKWRHAPLHGSPDILRQVKFLIFAGGPEEWPVFFEQFRSSTEDCGFSNAENMGRLRKCLKGKARETVAAMLAVPDNLTMVMACLERRFGRPDVIVQALIKRARSLTSPKDGDMVGFIDLSNAVPNLVSTMQLLKSDGHLHNLELRQNLVAKLPTTLQLQWGENTQQKRTSDIILADFSTWLTARQTQPVWYPISAAASPESTRKARVVIPSHTLLRPRQQWQRSRSRPPRKPQTTDATTAMKLDTSSLRARSLCFCLSRSDWSGCKKKKDASCASTTPRSFNLHGLWATWSLLKSYNPSKIDMVRVRSN